MSDLVKFQVWSPVLWRWRTAYVKRKFLDRNIELFRSYGFTVWTNGQGYMAEGVAA